MEELSENLSGTEITYEMRKGMLYDRMCHSQRLKTVCDMYNRAQIIGGHENSLEFLENALAVQVKLDEAEQNRADYKSQILRSVGIKTASTAMSAVHMHNQEQMQGSTLMPVTREPSTVQPKGKSEADLCCFFYNRHLRSEGNKCLKDPCTRKHERMSDVEYEQQKQRMAKARRRTPSPPAITYCKQFARGEPCPRMEKYGKCAYEHKTRAEIEALEASNKSGSNTHAP